MAEKVILPLNDESDDLVMRLTAAEARALHLLLSRLTANEMVEKGLSSEQIRLIDCVTPICY